MSAIFARLAAHSDELGGQARIGFEGRVKVGPGIELAEQFEQRALAERVDAAREMPQPRVYGKIGQMCAHRGATR